MSFRTNLQGLCDGVRRNLLLYACRTYKISLSPPRSGQALLYRNDKWFLSFGLPVLRTFGLLTATALASCSFNPNMQGKGETYIQGEWQQDSSAVQQKLVTFSQYHMRFDCDSFFVKIDDHSTVNYGSDTCMTRGQWAEYVRGTYHQRHDTLFLKGEFANADFSIKTKLDCFRAGPYEEFFKVVKSADSLMQLSGTSNVIPINLHRTKKTSCILKPL